MAHQERWFLLTFPGHIDRHAQTIIDIMTLSSRYERQTVIIWLCFASLSLNWKWSYNRYGLFHCYLLQVLPTLSQSILVRWNMTYSIMAIKDHFGIWPSDIIVLSSSGTHISLTEDGNVTHFAFYWRWQQHILLSTNRSKQHNALSFILKIATKHTLLYTEVSNTTHFAFYWYEDSNITHFAFYWR